MAPLLAKALGRGYIDLDEEIERRHGRSIPQIFAEDGESYFRTLERELVEEVSQADYTCNRARWRYHSPRREPAGPETKFTP